MTTPTSPPNQPWVWNYNPEADEWLLTTPEYDPMLSFRVTRILDKNKLIFARYQGSTMPREVAEVLVQVVHRMQLFAQADGGTREIIFPPDEVLRGAANVKRLWKAFPMGEAPASYFMRQER